MAKFLVNFRDATKKEIEADGFQETPDGKHYKFFKGTREPDKPNTVATIATDLVKTVEKILE